MEWKALISAQVLTFNTVCPWTGAANFAIFFRKSAVIFVHFDRDFRLALWVKKTEPRYIFK